MKTDVVVAGWGQITQPKQLTTRPLAPMGLMAEAARTAAGILKTPGFLRSVEGIFAVKSLSVYYENPAQDLANLFGAKPKTCLTSGIGGNSPQTMINIAAAMIARGELNTAIVAGAEAYVPRQPDARARDNALMKGVPEDYKGVDATGASPLEIQYGIEHPAQAFPLFETALWDRSGLDIGPYMETVAQMWSGFSQVACGHPCAWTKTPKTAQQIVTPSDQNRPIAFPYLKFMNAFVTVDMGAAVILMSAAYAQKHSPAKRPVYFCGGGFATDRQPFMIDKTDFTASHPLKAAVDKALDRSGMALSDMDVFDLYSCFPCAVSIARKMLDISSDDPRPMTLTGGLSFFGGPGNSYNLHAVATLCNRIAQGNTTTGMTTALGWMMQKHAAGIYSALPPKKNIAHMDIEDRDNSAAGPMPVETDEHPSGAGTIETYTIIYNRDQTPAYAVIYGTTVNGKRFIARSPQDAALYRQLACENMVGRTVRFSRDTVSELTIARPVDSTVHPGL